MACNASKQQPWFENPAALFCSGNIVPSGSVYSGQRINTVTRLTLLMTMVLVICKHKYWLAFLILAIVLIMGFYIFHKSKEFERFDFETLSDEYSKADNPSMSMTIKEDYYGSSDQINHDPKEVGQRDPNTGIQYFPMKQGVNRRMMVQPIIGTRITDQDVWGHESTKFRRTNLNNTIDITNSHIDTDHASLPTLGTPVIYENRTPSGVVPMNYLNEPTDIGYNTSSSFINNYNMDQRDFDKHFGPIYRAGPPNSIPGQYYQPQTQPPVPVRQPYVSTIIDPNSREYYMDASEVKDEINPNLYSNSTFVKSENPNNLSMKDLIPTREGFQLPNASNSEQADEQANRNKYMQQRISQAYEHMPPSKQVYNIGAQGNVYSMPQDKGPVAPPFDARQPRFLQAPISLYDNYHNQGGMAMLNPKLYTQYDQSPPGIDRQYPRDPTQLYQAAPKYVYTNQWFNQPEEKIILTDQQPKLYSYEVQQHPLNGSQIRYQPGKSKLAAPTNDQVYDAQTDKSRYPIYGRYDPQLLRTDGTPGMRSNNPVRTQWSQELSDFTPAPGSYDFEHIQPNSHLNYTDPNLSYKSVELGQVQYYTSNKDVYANPNFATPAKVDFVDFRNPNNATYPYYNRVTTSEEVRPHVESQWSADQVYHREDLMSQKMSQMNKHDWSARFGA